MPVSIRLSTQWRSFWCCNRNSLSQDRIPVTPRDSHNTTSFLAAIMRIRSRRSSYGFGLAIKKITNVFSKEILAKRALRKIKLLRHFRGHRDVYMPGRLYQSIGADLCRSPACMRDFPAFLDFNQPILQWSSYSYN
ncbi:hypothetical protein BJ878DRAFT_93731 [Calycina marina]|uniref:Uncharacterized protein n=1 Tax=Calycina marina TaxID=1763456 RepID=A0A9P7Z9J4_9HELO|nr:hypothetical protein BJ878DRAFT_93731 [Calycina marina]